MADTPIPYETTTERVVLADGETSGKRMRARAACALTKAAYAWMNVDVCVSRLGGQAPPKIASSREMVGFIFDVFPIREQHREHFMVICLDTRNQPIGVSVVSVGGLAYAAVDLKVLFKAALLLPASAIALVHNHPSNSPEPSADDMLITERIVKASAILDIRVLDHIIITDSRTNYFSFVDAGVMPR